MNMEKTNAKTLKIGPTWAHQWWSEGVVFSQQKKKMCPGFCDFIHDDTFRSFVFWKERARIVTFLKLSFTLSTVNFRI